MWANPYELKYIEDKRKNTNNVLIKEKPRKRERTKTSFFEMFLKKPLALAKFF